MHKLDDISLKKVACLFLVLSYKNNFPKTRSEISSRLRQNAQQSFYLIEQLSTSITKAEWNFAYAQYDLALDHSIRVLSYFDKDYPKNLREISDPPLLLYLSGELSEPLFSVAVVGARAATHQGCQIAGKIAREVVEAGGTVISGLALGIDAAAHRGALENCLSLSPGIAVLGSGLNYIYPHAHKNLANEFVASGGVIMSEYPINRHPSKQQFPERNRIISGLSDFTLVVEAGLRSGSLITARCALEQGRDVGAVPGGVFSSKSQGANELLSQGAVLVRDFSDIVEAVPKIKKIMADKKRSNKTPKLVVQDDVVMRFDCVEQKKVKSLLSLIEQHARIHLDDLVSITNVEFIELQTLLSQMELYGLIIKLPGDYYEMLAI